MSKTNWINFLHFYQPPTTPDSVIEQVYKECYLSWVDFLLKHKNIKVTINITACLTEKLASLKHKKLLDHFSKLSEKGQVELVESAAFHPILPLLPEKEIIKQIKINNHINKKYLKNYKPQGFYIPEMAYSVKVAQVIKKLKYKYIILDEIALNEKVDNNIKYKLKNGLIVIFRNRKNSQTFVPEKILNLNEGYAITATDAELYGHRYWNWWPPYSAISKNKNIQTLTISEYFKKLNKIKIINPLKSSWESTKEEIKNKNYFSLWNNPKNIIQQKLWQLANFALKLNYKNIKDRNYFASRLHLEKGLASCTFWWASNKDFKLFSPVAWNPSMVESGAAELLMSVRSLNKINPSQKILAEKLFSSIRNLIWKKHWKNEQKNKGNSK